MNTPRGRNVVKSWRGDGAAAPDREIPAAAGGLSGCAIIERGLFVTSTTGRRLYALPLDGAGEPESPADYLIGAYGRLRTVVAAPDGVEIGRCSPIGGAVGECRLRGSSTAF